MRYLTRGVAALALAMLPLGCGGGGSDEDEGGWTPEQEAESSARILSEKKENLAQIDAMAEAFRAVAEKQEPKLSPEQVEKATALFLAKAKAEVPAIMKECYLKVFTPRMLRELLAGAMSHDTQQKMAEFEKLFLERAGDWGRKVRAEIDKEIGAPQP